MHKPVPPARQAPPNTRLADNTVAAVVRALAMAEVDRARRHIETLRTMIPGHPLLAHLERQLAVIGFNWPLTRAGFNPEGGVAPESNQVELVAFHANLPVTPSGVHARIDYLEVLALSLESAAIRAPQAKRILLTDAHTTVPSSLMVDDVIRFPIDTSKLMYERMRVQALYLEQRRADRVSVLLDSDVVINRDPAVVFTEAFDVGLTWRAEFADAPFNGGVLFVGKGPGGAAFFHRAIACYDALAASGAVTSVFPADLRAWWGDQFALAATVGYRAYATRRTEGMEVEGLRIRLFPCSEYNFTIEPKAQYPRESLRQKFCVHFKGNRKALQAEYLALMRENRL